ncbi:MAG: hypothetical protein WBA41_23265 [Rivularia sp. (in: cyanobacteria)]
MQPNKQLSEAVVIQLLEDILEVLAFVHQQQVINMTYPTGTIPTVGCVTL